MTFLEKYIWVVNTLSHAGEKGLSLKELNEKWLLNEDPVMANQSPDRPLTGGKEHPYVVRSAD